MDTQNSFNPLDEKINEKIYAGGGAAGRVPSEDIAEPQFMPPPIDLNGDTPSASDGEKPKKESGKKTSEPFNQELNELSDPEKKKAAEQAAQFAMSLYKGLHLWGNSMIRISDRKINKLQSAGDIDLNVGVPYGNLGFVRLGEFISEYNSQAGEVLQVSQEFEENVLPPLTRVLAKKGMGMTDENYLAFMFGQDMISKGMTVMSMRRTTKDILAFAKEQTTAGRTVQATMAMPSAPVQQEQAPVVHMTESPVANEPTTLQDRALANVQASAAGEGGVILPNIGSNGKIKQINELYEQDLKVKQKEENIRKKLGKSNQVPKPRRKRTAVPGKKETRGRKPKNNLSNPTPTAN
jgi:hypothetical protein